MLRFDPNDPFPLLAPGSASYGEQKEHARAVDVWLGLRIAETEARIPDQIENQEHWKRLGPGTFLTPYTEIRAILELLQPQGLVVDLGAGYGRMGFVLERHWPSASFLGYELVPERVEEGGRVYREHGLQRARLKQADLADLAFEPAAARDYFLYDFGTQKAIGKCLLDLQEHARSAPIRVVGRGRGVRDEIERGHPWLTEIVAPIHRANYSLYQS